MQSTEHDAVTTTLDGLVEAWNDADAERYGAWFTDDATYVTFTGTVYRGRADIAAGHAALFAGLLKGTKLVSGDVEVRVLSDTVAVATARGDTYKGDRPRKVAKVQTYTLVRDADGEWRVAAFHNTQHRPVMEWLQFRMNPLSRPLRDQA